jgi:hypothetical protein
MRPVDRTLRWLPAILMMAAIFLFSSIPSTEMPSFGFWDLLVKKGGHATGYGLLALSFWFALKWDRRWIWLAFVLTALYAGSDEFHQSFVLGMWGLILLARWFFSASHGWSAKRKSEKVLRFSLFSSHLLLVTLHFLTAPKISATPPSSSTPIHT